MEVWECFEILNRKKQGWFSKHDNVEEKRQALTRITEIGLPSTIFSLIPFLKYDNIHIQTATCNTIIILFNRLKSKKDYYETLKHCDISEPDLDLFAHWFNQDQLVQLLAIASLNGNGYVREKAVKKLSGLNDPKAIQFLIYRLADWVLPVRQKALSGLNNFKKKEFIDAFVNNLFLSEWLQQVERIDLVRIYNEILNFIVDENKGYISKSFTQYSEKTRLILAKYIAKSASVDSKAIKLLLNDKHFLVRTLVLAHLDKLKQEDVDKLLNDKSSKVRLQVLYKLQNNLKFSDIAIAYVADNAASIREFARYSLKDENLDFARIYYNNLLNNKYIIGSLLGIAEVNAKQFSRIVESYLQDKQVKVKKVAFLSLKKLEAEKAYGFAVENLGSGLPGIRDVIIEFLVKKATSEVLEKARSIYKMGDQEIKKSMLKLFSQIGSWAVLADIILATIDNDEIVRSQAFIFLQRWKIKAVRLFTQPKADELERAKQIFGFAYNVHESKRYFKNNPLLGLDFYLK